MTMDNERHTNMKQVRNQLSFLPDDYLPRKRQRRANALFGCLFVIEVAGIVAAGGLAERSLHSAQADNQRITSEYTNAARRIEQATQLQQRQKTMMRQAALTQSLQENVPRSKLLAEITNAKPEGVSLLDLLIDEKKATAVVVTKTQFELRKAQQEKKGQPPLPRPIPTDVRMKITGMAMTDVQVAQFMTRLMRCEMLKDVNLLVSEQFKRGNETLRRFQIELSLDPAADGGADDAGHSGQRTASVDLQ